MIDEERFRKICRSEEGGIQSLEFSKALKGNDSDPVPVNIYADLEYKTIYIPRRECEIYAQIADEEIKPENDLLEYIEERMHPWVRNNRSKMVAILKELVLEFKQSPLGVVVVWPLCQPSNIPIEVVNVYISRYSR